MLIFVYFLFKFVMESASKETTRTSLVLQWLGLHTPKKRVRGSQVQSLVGELDPMYHNQ